jgi:hypothetical protein
MSILDRLLGRGGSSVTVPVMDGPFLPNQKLETAEVASALAEADNLTVSRSALYASSGAKLLKSVDGVAFELVEEFPQAISAAGGSETSLAIGIDGEGLVVRGGPFDGVSVRGHGDDLRCLTAIAWLNDHEIIVCNGSAMARTNEWRRSLMQLDASGSVTKVDLKTGTTARLADGLAWPAGIAAGGSGLFVSESWRHRIVSMPLAGGSRQSSGLSRAHRRRGRWGLLDLVLLGAQSARGVHSPGAAVPYPDDRRDRGGVLDGPLALLREQLSGTDAG